MTRQGAHRIEARRKETSGSVTEEIRKRGKEKRGGALRERREVMRGETHRSDTERDRKRYEEERTKAARKDCRDERRRAALRFRKKRRQKRLPAGPDAASKPGGWNCAEAARKRSESDARRNVASRYEGDATTDSSEAEKRAQNAAWKQLE